MSIYKLQPIAPMTFSDINIVHAIRARAWRNVNTTNLIFIYDGNVYATNSGSKTEAKVLLDMPHAVIGTYAQINDKDLLADVAFARAEMEPA